jgi:hypothetical protein
LHSAGSQDDLLYFTMPYISGESLRHALLAGHRFSVREVVGILRDVAGALAHAHAQGVIHRDIKPGNVLRSHAHAVVTDFGVAKAISSSMSPISTGGNGIAIGSPAYMAPEQLAGDPAADHRMDIYALGLLGYELLSGRMPFQATSPQDTLAAQLTRAPDPIHTTRGDVPPELDAIIARCLAKNPADRPQSASEVAEALGNLESPPLRSPAPGARITRIGVVAVACLLLLVAMGRAMRLDLFRTSQNSGTPTSDAAASPSGHPVTAVVGNLLTFEDSLAIARAVQQKLDQEGARVSTRRTAVELPSSRLRFEDGDTVLIRVGVSAADSLRTRIEAAVLDSVSRRRGLQPGLIDRFYVAFQSADPAYRQAPDAVDFRVVDGNLPRARIPADQRDEPAGSRRIRRVFVSGPIEMDESWGCGAGGRDCLPALFDPAVDSLVNRLRHSIGRLAGYQLVPVDAVSRVLERTRSPSDIAESLQVDVFVTVVGQVLVPPTSVLWRVIVRDLTAPPSEGTRAVIGLTPRTSLLARADSLTAYTLRFLGAGAGPDVRNPD